MGIRQVKEKSKARLTVSFFDEDGSAATPSTISYRVDCDTTGNNIRSATSVSAASVVNIDLDNVDNAMQVHANKREMRRVTVTATFGGTDESNDEFTYEVIGLPNVS